MDKPYETMGKINIVDTADSALRASHPLRRSDEAARCSGRQGGDGISLKIPYSIYVFPGVPP